MGDTPTQLRAGRDAALKAAQLAMRDTTRLMRLLTILGQPTSLEVLLDDALATLSELFAADIVVLLDPAGTGGYVPLAAVGLPEELINTPFSSAESSHGARAIRSGMPLMTTDAASEPDLDAQLRDLDVATAVWLPVSGSDGPRGVLILARCQNNPFNHADVGLLSAMAYRIGIALEQAQRRMQLEIMVRASQQIGCHLDTTAVAREAVHIFPSIVGADAAALVLTDATDKAATIERSGNLDASRDGLWLTLADHYWERARQDADWVFSTASLEAELSLRGLNVSACAVHGLLAVPLRHQGRPQGILFALRFVPTAFPPDCLQIAKLYAGETSSALENAHLCETLRVELKERRALEEDLRRSNQQVKELLAARTLQLDEAHQHIWLQKQELQELYDSAPCGYHSLDAGGVFLRVNATEQSMLGYSAEEMVGRMNIRDVVAPHCRHLVDERWPSVASTGDFRDHRYDFLRRDGSMFPGVITGKILRDEQGGFIATRCVLIDDTDRAARDKQIANLGVELERRAIAAEAANRAKSQFLATMSHEVRTPLHAIMGFTDLLRVRVQELDHRDKLDKITLASTHLLSILDNVLDIARFDSVGSLVLENHDFDFDTVLRRVVEPMAEKAHGRGLAFDLEMSLVPRMLHGDALRLGEILRALLDNAVKFTDKGTVQFRGRVVEEDDRRVILRFDIQDTGIGIAPDDHERIFQAFVQADGSSTRRHGGVGLGLTIARRLARLMGGDIVVASTPCVGSTFSATLPFEKVGVRASSAAAGTNGTLEPVAALRRDYAGTNVLLVEDDAINQAVMEELLADAGVRCDIAGDGLVAIEMSKRHAYPAILMDMKMPRLDGPGATRVIRRLPGYREIPIIAVTANTLDEDREECLRAGMNDFLAKPVSPDVLYATLLGWLQRSK
jgi:PAS domain S-box-containing protein